MHPDILRQLAADHIRDLIAQAGEARQAHKARHAQRRRLPAHPRRSTRLYSQQRESHRGSRTLVTPGAAGQVESGRP